jgi:hypothetical protein
MKIFYTADKMSHDVNKNLLEKYLKIYFRAKQKFDIDIHECPVDLKENTKDLIDYAAKTITCMSKIEPKAWYLFFGEGSIEHYKKVFVILLCRDIDTLDCLYSVYKHSVFIDFDPGENKLCQFSILSKCFDHMFLSNNVIQLSYGSEQNGLRVHG